jgi:trigger factor
MTEETASTVEEQTSPPEEQTTDGKEVQKKLNQTVEMKEVGPCKKHIKVTVSREDITKLLDEKYAELVGDSIIPGFRPGKAPREIVVRKFRKDVQDQVKGQVLLASLEQLAEENDIAPLSPPNLNPGALEIPKEGPFIYEFDVEVRPDFALPNYKGLKIRRPIRQFTDEDVTREQNRILARYGQLVPKPEGDAQIGDYLIVDMTTRFDQSVIGSAKEITLRVDDTLAFKDGVAKKFGAQTLGAKAGETRVVDIDVTEGVALDQLRGKTVQATLEIKDVKKLRLPELTHEFLHTFGVHSPEQLHEMVRVLLERRLEYQQRQSAREQILEQIAGTAALELPQDMLVRQARRAFARRVMEMRESGISEEEIESRKRMLEQDVLRNAANSLKEHFVLQKIAEVEKLDVDEDEINDEIERLAEQNGESPRKLRAQLEREELLDTMAGQLVERKALDMILETAEFEDVQTSEEGGISSVEQQAVPGEMKDPTAAPPEEAKPEGEPAATTT